MISTQTIRRHARLFADLAEAHDIDLEEAVLKGDISPDDISEGVLRCTGCASPDDCEASLAESSSASDLPPYCRNAAMLQMLKGQG